MSEFIFLYRGAEAASSPKEQQDRMQAWGTWMKELGSHLKSPGQPLDPKAGKVVRAKGKSIVDGPFAEAKDVIGGYSIVEAKDLEQAAELARGCPILHGAGAVEVRPVIKLDM